MPTEAAVRVVAPEDLPRPPRYATRRNPDLRTRGGKIGVIAATMGKALKAHQQYIADVATELNPRGSRLRYRYQLVVISLPRQTGKTTLLRPVFVERTLSCGGTQAFMTAQMGKDARARWEDLVGDLKESEVFGSFASIKEGQGSERLSFPNGSFISPFAPGKESLHGYSPPLVNVDEGWAFSAEQGADLMKAIRPAQITKTDRQLWIISAEGDSTSEWWNALVKAGRASVKDPRSKMAYFEWSMDEFADPYDPASWEFHPGLDGLITIEDLAEEAKPENNSHGDFLRGFMNVSTKTRDKTVIPLKAWDARKAKEQTPPDPDTVAYAFDVALDRTSASVWAAWMDADGRLQLHVDETREDAAWLTEYLSAKLSAGLPVLAADDGGPARLVTAALRRAGHTIETLSGRDYGTAWTSLKAHVNDGTLDHDGSPALRGAIELAAEKSIGDATAPSRKHSLGPIDPLIAATVAAWHAERLNPLIPIY